MKIMATTLTADEFTSTVWRAGRVNGPALLFDAWYTGQLTPTVLGDVIGTVWSMAEYPERSLGRATWRELFDAAGNPGRPSEPVRLYRGAPHSRRRRWAWTSDPLMAERFATGGLRGREHGTVWTTVAPPVSVLCAITDGRGEDEYVVDTRGLTVTAVPARARACGSFPEGKMTTRE